MTLPRSKLTPITTGSYVCADCSEVEPGWASLNRGVFICTECCSIHRSLGRHVSLVKSLKRAAWNSKQLALVQTLYAHGSNNVWEHLLLDPVGSSKAKKKPGPKDPLYPTKADFIRAKYQNLSFALRPGRAFGDTSSSSGHISDGGCGANASSPADLNRQLHSCVRTGHVETTLRLLALGADPNGHLDPETGASPLHVAAREGQDLQVELLVLYGAEPGVPDFNDQKAADVAEASGHPELAARLVELQYELTDRMVAYLCGGRKPDHQNGQHFIIPEIATQGDLAAGKIARKHLRLLSDSAFEKLAQDVYDEVDRREVDASWSACLSEDALLINDRYVVPFLPVNADLPATRNQRRQKLAKFNGREFAALLIDIVSELKRRFLAMTGQIDEKATAENQAPDQKLGQTRSNKAISERNGSRGDSTSKDSPIQASSKEVTSGKLSESDGPLYDTVASEDDADEDFDITLLSAVRGSNGLNVDDFVDLKCQLAAAEARVGELEKRNSDVSSEVEQLRLSMDRLSSENKQLKSSSFQALSQHQQLTPELLEALQTLHSPTHAAANGQRPPRSLAMRHSGDILCSESESDIASKRRIIGDRIAKNSSCNFGDRRRSSAEAAYGQDASTTPPSSGLDFDSVGGLDISPSYPDNLILKTEHLTGEIHLLLVAAQAGRHDRFAGHASRIQIIVDSMAHAVPVQFKRKSIQKALDSMVDACILLTVRCSNGSNANTVSPETAEKISCQVVQVAYEVARAAKELMVLIQK